MGKITKQELDDSVKQELDDAAAHKAEKVHQSEVHGMRVTDGKFEYFDGVDWQTVKGDGYPVGNVVNLTSSPSDATVTLTWQDPPDVTIEDTNGNIITIAKWAGTKVLRKTGSYPVNENDGDLVVDNVVRNQYQTDGFNDVGLINGTEYFYMAFPYTEDGILTVDSANRISAIPTEVFTDMSGSPGATQVIAGDEDAGYFGTVPASELWTGSQLASAAGVSQGTLQHDTTPWLKFVHEGKILFRPMKAFRHSISWDHINSAGCVFGTKTVTKNGLTYKVRLMRGALTNPSKNNDSDRGAKGSEWNKLMLPIHEQAVDGSWAYPAYVEDDIPDWGIGFTDADLLTHSTHGNGSYVWCQETPESDPSTRVARGGNGVSYSGWSTSSSTLTARGWAPVLELL